MTTEYGGGEQSRTGHGDDANRCNVNYGARSVLYAYNSRQIVRERVRRRARLGVADVERWHDWLRRRGLRDGSVRNQHAAFRAALTLAVRWGLYAHAIESADVGVAATVATALDRLDRE